MFAFTHANPLRMARPTLSAVLAGAVLLSACSEPVADYAAAPTPVRTQPAGSGPSVPSIATNGIVAIRDEMRLSFKVGGIIKTLRVREGDAVRKGAVLAEIELAEINAQVEQARQLAEKAQRDLARGERLHSDQVISLEQLQDLRTQAAVAQAQLRSAEFNRGYAVITAPVDGIVLRRHAEERELVTAGQPVLTVGARESGYVVRSALSDREIVQLKLGDVAEIRMDAYPGQTFRGTLSEIAGASDARTGLFPVEVRFDSPPVALASGLVAKLRIRPSAGEAHSLTYVPIAAIVEGNGHRASVFVVEGDHARRRDVRVAFITPDAVALAEGVEPGEQVVTDGALYLEDNELIEIVDETTRVVGTPGALTG
jgi:multidrug efflux system membrane fusion protein